MAATSRIKRPIKPTVFLSHSSTNRRELLGLKRLLDERAGGLIDFFLSSDDDSIAHGTIWPAEVRAALDRMSLMLIFVSSEALKSGWTYFEAGYGLHKLGSAKIYCLPGTEKGSLPTPFNILQNRNLHSVRDVGLLIKQCNEELGATLKESVSQEEFDRIFKKPLTVKLETGPSFEQLVRSVTVSATGPANSAEIFSTVCQKKGFAVSRVPDYESRDAFVSTGLRLSIAQPDFEKLSDELVVDKSVHGSESLRIREQFGIWVLLEEDEYAWKAQTISPAELEAYNAKIREKNEEKRRRNDANKLKPRACSFELAANNIQVPIGIIDDWMVGAKIGTSLVTQIKLKPEVQRETRIEAITAKIHGSELSLRNDGKYLWGTRTIVEIKWINYRDFDLELTSVNRAATPLSEFQIQELVVSLFEQKIISLPTQRSGTRRK